MGSPLVPKFEARHPHQRLAAAVLLLAVRDAAGLIGRERHPSEYVRDHMRRDAYEWLSETSVELEFWCEMAGIDAETMIDGLDMAIEHARRVSVMKR